MRFPAFLAALSALTVLLCACAPQSDTGGGRKLADSSSGASAIVSSDGGEAAPSGSLPADSSGTTTSQPDDPDSYGVPIMPPDSSRFMGPDYSSEEFVPTLPPEALEPQTIVTVSSSPPVSDPELMNITHQYTNVTKQDLLALPAGLTYREIMDRLGKTERINYAQTEVLHYLYDVDGEKVLILSCKSKEDVCPDSGAALYDRCVAYDFDVDDAIVKGAYHPATAVCLYDNVFYSTTDYASVGFTSYKFRSIRYEHYENYGGGNSKTFYTKFSFSDGSPASKKDLKPGTQIVYWGLLGTMHQSVAYIPPICWPSHIVIMK